jgi:hypothetical protein
MADQGDALSQQLLVRVFNLRLPAPVVERRGQRGNDAVDSGGFPQQQRPAVGTEIRLVEGDLNAGAADGTELDLPGGGVLRGGLPGQPVLRIACPIR